MTVQGEIDEIRFRNDENGYTILVLDHEGEPLVCVGTLPPVSEGERLTLTGDFTVHPRFGKQFKIKTAVTETPETPDSLIRYLGSGVIKGVGPKLAYSIVERFGVDTLDIMENAPQRLASIRGISVKKAIEIGAACRENRAARESVMFLESNNISLNLALKIFRQYGNDTVAKVKSNPYRLIEDVDGVGFLTADRIARDMGIAADSPARLRAGLIYVLRTSGEVAGNTYLPEQAAYEETARLLNVDEDLLAPIAEELILDRRLKRVSIDDEAGLMTVSAFRAEQSAAQSLVRLITQANRLGEDVTDDVAEFERVHKVQFAARQAEAVRLALNAGVAIITGGPGTGKTTIVKCILSIFKARNKKVLLMAPTGRAAKRLAESTGDEASTIHRALGSLEEFSTLKCDAVIVDEFSMVDVYLLDMLLGKIAPGTNMLIVGDKDQLPSVGAGNVLSDMLSSGLIPSVTLDTVYRQADAGLIIENAHRVNRGQMPILTRNDSDFFFSRSTSAAATAQTVVDMVSRRLPKYLGCDPSRVQVLCPMKNGDAGVVNLNRLLQDAVNPDRGQGQIGGEVTFRVGDKVMHTANNYSLEWRRGNYSSESGKGIFNGDMGTVAAVDKNTGEMTVTFEDGRTAVYTADLRSQLIPAYAVTVHKSQGSEFDAVVLPLTGGSPMIMTRNLLYTAITRARKLAVLVGEEYHVRRMVENNYIAKRYSCLKSFLLTAYKKDSLLYGGNGETE
ncbi:MAG: ATP-dependent RecD-like DNA helicase [Clostridia bacterium]|nr:ATP-dependent RecD-like DNA helicase [Clostridia bacterium]